MSMQEDCFWYIDSRVPKKEQKMLAMCTECHKEHSFGWFWNGKKMGFGNYDLKCSICDAFLHQRESLNETKAD